MPKETFGNDNLKATVSWGRDGAQVQVATVNAAGERLPAEADGWYATLGSRAEVNRMIRVLRTARDQAFGRDE